MTVQIRTVALLVTIDFTVTAISWRCGATAGVKPTERGAAKFATTKAPGHTSVAVQIRAVTLLADVQDAVATNTRTSGTGASVERTVAVTAKHTACKPFRHARGRAEFTAIAILATLNSAVAAYPIVATTAAKRHQRTPQQKHRHQATFKPIPHYVSSSHHKGQKTRRRVTTYHLPVNQLSQYFILEKDQNHWCNANKLSLWR
jgi:hypothetical protein